jgi:alpha-beta hydrolase superfamily lysophospholipase
MSPAIIDAGGSQAVPLYFKSGERSLFGWLHQAHGARPAHMGLVICQPFGYEAICAHRSLRAFAEDAAACGITVLRFDYAGTGNSQDMDPGADQLRTWTEDALGAVAELRKRAGVERVCLLGFRLGAIVAAQAAQRCDAGTPLAVIAPILSGARYLRELRTIQLAADSQLSAAAPDAAAAAADEPGAMHVSGFSLTAATVAALSQFELANFAMPQVRELLIIDRKELPGARAWSDSLLSAGVKVQYLALPGFVRMMMTAPHFSLVPQSMIDATRGWLQGIQNDGAPCAAPSAAAFRCDDPVSQVLRLPFDLTETPVLLSSDPGLFAIVTESADGESRRRGVILLNAGATHHVGPNRMYVTLARQWAQRGYVVLRMDLAGLGDSAVRSGRNPGDVYPAAALEDIRIAVDFMRERFGISDLALGGLCSGAYHALRAAHAALPVNRVLMVNPLNFLWHEGMTLDGLTWLGFVHNPRRYVAQVLPTKFWRKLLTGQVNGWRVLKLFAQYSWVVVDSTARNAARALHLPLPEDLGYQLQAIAGRGTQMTFLFARGDPGINLLEHQGGSALKGLSSRCRIHSIDGADHIFSQRGARKQLERLLSEELFARQTSMPCDTGGGLDSHLSREQVSE